MRHIQIPAGMGLEEFALSYIEGERPGHRKSNKPMPAAGETMPDYDSHRAIRKHRKVEYREAEPEITAAPILKPSLFFKEEATERSFTPMMPPSAIPHQALPPLMPSPSDEVFAEPEMPTEPIPEDEIDYEAAEENVEEMEPSAVMGAEEEGTIMGVEDEDEEGSETGSVSPAVEGFKWLGALSQGQPPASSEPLPSLPDLLSERQPSVLPVLLLAAGFIAVGAIIYAIKNPQVVSGEAE